MKKDGCSYPNNPQHIINRQHKWQQIAFNNIDSLHSFESKQ